MSLILKPFTRDPDEPYTVEAVIESFFMDRNEWGRAQVNRLRKISPGEKEGKDEARKD